MFAPINHLDIPDAQNRPTVASKSVRDRSIIVQAEDAGRHRLPDGLGDIAGGHRLNIP